MGTRRTHGVLRAWVGSVLVVGTAVVGAQSIPAPRPVDVTATGPASEPRPASRSSIPAAATTTPPPTSTPAPPTTASSRSTTAETSPPGASVVAPAPPPPESSVSLAPPPDSPPPSAPVPDVVSGLVTDLAGNPVPGVCVHANNGAEFTPVTRTGADGRYALTVEIGPGLMSASDPAPHLFVLVPPCGEPLGWVSSGNFLRAGRAPVMTADLVVSRGAAIGGRLIDSDGRPVNDVQLSVRGYPQVVRADGTFGPVGPLTPGEVLVQGVRDGRSVMLNNEFVGVVLAASGAMTEVELVVRSSA